MGTERNLSELKPGEKAKVQGISGKGLLKKRLLDMGVIAGTPVEVLKVAPLGDPIDIKVKGYQLTLRKAEASQVQVIVGV